MRAGLALLVGVFIASPAHAGCHIYSIWNFPWKQHCPVKVAQMQPPPLPPALPPPERRDTDIPLPSLENMEFPPDSPNERLKGVGMLRELLGTN